MKINFSDVQILKDRIGNKIRKLDSGCWEYTGSKAIDKRGGYGLLRFKKTLVRAHRIMLMHHTKQIPNKKTLACHKCDNPICVNPDHLFWGSHLDNMRDCARKGRTKTAPTVWGEACHLSRLKENQVLEIRRLCVLGDKPMRIIAEQFSVSTALVKDIKYRRCWKHL